MNGRTRKLLIAMAFSWVLTTPLVAETQMPDTDRHDPTHRRPRQFRAEGEHICWSRTSIGHKCFVHGVQYTDCQHAYFSLSREDCCPRSEYEGSSVGFELKKCTAYY